MWPLLLSTVFVGALGLRTLEPPPPPSTSRAEPEERWLDIRLDHFSAFNNDTFPMRYYYNDLLAVPNRRDNHIVIEVGGQWTISPEWVTGGLAFEIAEFLNAGVFYTEHRFYGLSRPTNDTDVDNLRYLTADQALGDLAQFIQHVKSENFQNGMYSGGKVVLVGCSYAGSLATWMRLGYPHLVDAVFSDSAPLQAQVDFVEYFEKINDVISEQGGSACVTAIGEAIAEIEALLATEAGANTISDVFNTCGPQQTNQMDASTLMYSITDTIAELVQYALPGNVSGACAALTDASESSAMRRLANFVNSYPSSQPCIRNSYAELVAGHTNTSFDAEDSETRLWTYQSCVQFGWFQSTDGEHHPFSNAVPLEFFQQMCQDYFSLYFNSNLTDAGVRRTNLFFGGLTHLPDHVVSVSGGADPWAPLGPTEADATPLSHVLLVPRASHCRAIHSTQDSETDEILEAKWEVINLISEIITGTRANSATGVFASLALVLCAVLSVIA